MNAVAPATSRQEEASRPEGETLSAVLSPGDSVGHWRLGRRRETRFDVADRPMAGAMDAAFFLGGSYIPHEYPGRTEFAALRRGRPPVPTIAFEPDGWWFPFGSPRVDLSGFWFRPTVVEARAETVIAAEAAVTARFRFSTCGGAILSVNGADVASLSGYKRNFEEATEVDIALNPGANRISVWFDDLAERDARIYFELRLIAGQGLSVTLPVPDASLAEAVGRLLDGMRFEQPSYGDGFVAIRFPEAAPATLDATIAIRDESIGSETVERRRELPAGADRIVIGAAADLPPDFRHFRVTLAKGEFALSRVLGVEIAHPMVEPPASIEARAEEALRHAGWRGERNPERVLAQLALGRTGRDTDVIIEASLPAIADCYDCADFLLVPLLWCRAKWPDAIGRDVRERLDQAILGFRYWLDESGNDVMWFFSENHALLFHTAAYLAGTTFPEGIFIRSGRSGRAQAEAGRKRLVAWFDHFEAAEMAEWNSAPYFPIDFKGFAALLALAPDRDIRDRAEAAILRLLEIVALSSHRGFLTASQGRSYEHSLRPARSLEINAIARLVFGHGGGYGRHFHALPEMALLVRDHGLRPDPALAGLADFRGEGSLEWCFRQGPKGLAALYHHKARDHAMGTVAAYRAGEHGYQETVLHLRLGDEPDAQVWINHPGERIVSGFARPSYWGGCGTLPRVHQYRDLAIAEFELPPGQVDFTHAFLPEAAFDEVVHLGERVLVRSGAGYALIAGSVPFQRVTDGPMAGLEIRQPGTSSRWLVRLGDTASHGSLAAFDARFAGLAPLTAPDGSISIDDPDYGRVVCRLDGSIAGEGRVLRPSSFTHAGRLVRWPAGEEIQLPSLEPANSNRLETVGGLT